MSARKPARKPAAPPAIATPNRGGRPPHVPDAKTRARVTAWSGGGIGQDMIALSLDIARPTLREHYAKELRIGKAMVDGLAVSTIVAAMQGGGKQAIIAAKHWTATQMGWTEKIVVDDGKPVGPMRVIIELVGDPAPVRDAPAITRPGFDRNLIELVG